MSNANDLLLLAGEWIGLKEKIKNVEREMVILADLEIPKGKSILLGDCKILHSAGTTTWDWEVAASEHHKIDIQLIDSFTSRKTITTIDWKGICKELKINESEWEVPVKIKPVPSIKISMRKK